MAVINDVQGSQGHWYPLATDVSIRALALLAIAAGGGTIHLPAAQIAIASPLPISDCIQYIGVAPKITKPTNVPIDQDFIISGGTRLIGNATTGPLAAGTYMAFQFNDTASASVPTAWNGISGVVIEGMSLEGFKRGISMGNYNQMSIVNSRIKDVIVSGCVDDWGVWLANYHRCHIENLVTANCLNGQFKASMVPQATFMPGNSTDIESYNYKPQASLILVSPLFCRGLVWSAGAQDGVSNAKLNELMVIRPQSSARYNTTQLSVAANVTSGSTSVAVPDSTVFKVGMPLRFTTSANGTLQDKAMFVLSIPDATHITVGNSPTGTAFSFTGTAAMTITSYGFPDMELTAENSAGAVQSSTFIGADFEGLPEIGVLFNNTTQTKFDINEVSNTLSTHIVMRSSQVNLKSQDNVGAALIIDADSGSSQLSRHDGARGNTIQYDLAGSGIDWKDTANPIRFDQLMGSFVRNGGSSLTGSTMPQRDRYGRQARLTFDYDATASGQRVSPLDTSSSIGDTKARSGCIEFNGATGQTFTLPTIVIDTTPALSNVGLEIEVDNYSANALTVATNGTQTFNNVASFVSMSLPAQTTTKFKAVKLSSNALIWRAGPSQALRVS